MTLVGITSSRQHELVDAAEAASMPIATGRRFAFLPLSSTAGTSTVATLVARALARGRSGRTLVVETSVTSAGVRAAGAQTPPPTQAAGLPLDVARTLGYADGVWLGRVGELPGSASDASEAATSSDWFQRVAPLARHFDVVCTAWHPQPRLTAAVSVTTTAQAVCLVSPFGRAEGEAAVAFARALHADPDAPRVMVAFVDVANTRSTWPRLVAPQLDFPTVSFGYDARLAAGGRGRPATERAAILAAGALMRLGTPAVEAR